jgi:hypothetical protein
MATRIRAYNHRQWHPADCIGPVGQDDRSPSACRVNGKPLWGSPILAAAAFRAAGRFAPLDMGGRESSWKRKCLRMFASQIRICLPLELDIGPWWGSALSPAHPRDGSLPRNSCNPLSTGAPRGKQILKFYAALGGFARPVRVADLSFTPSDRLKHEAGKIVATSRRFEVIQYK